MTSLIKNLPLDIIIDIIDEVATTDDSASTNVRSCSLICKLFLQHCRKHIFHSITIDIESGRRCRLFRGLVESAPWVPDYVRVLEITPIAHYYDVSDEEEAALKKLNNLHTLIMIPASILGLDWRMLPPATLDVFIHLIQLPTIINLKLVTFLTFNPSFLIPCTRLKHLYIRNSRLKYYNEYDINVPQNQDGSTNTQSSPILPSLLPDAINTDSFTALSLITLIEPRNHQFNPIMDIAMLKKISFKITSSAENGSCLELFSYLKGLTIIHFKLSHTSHSLAIVPSIIASKSLNTLHTLRIFLDFHGRFVPQVCHVLRELAGRNRISTLILASTLFPSDSGTNGLEDWSPIADVLLSGGWPLLRRLDVNFYNITWERFDLEPEQIHIEDAVRRTYEMQLEKLSKTSAFQYNLTITRGPWSEDL